MRTGIENGVFSHRPFSGEGVSLYAAIGTAPLYRALRVLGPFVKGTSDRHPVGSASSVTKTARVASQAGSSGTLTINWPIPAGYASQQASFDVRHYKDDAECETVLRHATMTLDAGRNIVTVLGGTALLAGIEILTGGKLRLRFEFSIPARFKWQRTAGPTSPADLVLNYAGAGLYEVDTVALSDAGAYTFRLRGEDGGGSLTKDYLTGVVATPDATGPPALTSPTTESR